MSTRPELGARLAQWADQNGYSEKSEVLAIAAELRQQPQPVNAELLDKIRKARIMLDGVGHHIDEAILIDKIDTLLKNAIARAESVEKAHATETDLDAILRICRTHLNAESYERLAAALNTAPESEPLTEGERAIDYLLRQGYYVAESAPIPVNQQMLDALRVQRGLIQELQKLARRDELPELGEMLAPEFEILCSIIVNAESLLCKECGGHKVITVECECYEFHGGHQMGCPYYGAKNIPASGFERPCPECNESAPAQTDVVSGLLNALHTLSNRRAGAAIKSHPKGCGCSVHIAKRAIAAYEAQSKAEPKA